MIKIIASPLKTPEKEKEFSYWNGNGKHQKKVKILEDKLATILYSDPSFDWKKNDEWALFNGMTGIYYAKHNDGDSAEGAIDNNRVHGYRNVKDFERLAKEYGANQLVWYMSFKTSSSMLDNVLEKAMDEVVELTWKWIKEEK
jgi:hypothetical protein